MRHITVAILYCLLCCGLVNGGPLFRSDDSSIRAGSDFLKAFVRVSKTNPAYLELTDGKLFIPVGVNICWPRFVSSEDSVIRKMEHYFTQMAKHGGNFTRVWKAIAGLDPREEQFEPFTIDHPGMKVYGLRGRKTILLWCRDKGNSWESELVAGRQPAVKSGMSVRVPFQSKPAKITFYDPWKDTESVLKRKGDISLPDFRVPAFRRSGIVRISLEK